MNWSYIADITVTSFEEPLINKKLKKKDIRDGIFMLYGDNNIHMHINNNNNFMK